MSMKCSGTIKFQEGYECTYFASPRCCGAKEKHESSSFIFPRECASFLEKGANLFVCYKALKTWGLSTKSPVFYLPAASSGAMV